MRHLLYEVALLAGGMVSTALLRGLVSPARSMQGITTSQGGAFSAIPVSAITATANPYLAATTTAEVKTIGAHKAALRQRGLYV